MTAQKKESVGVRSVNSQITDAITQANTINIGLAPAQAIGTLYQTTSQAIGASIQNSVSNQQHMYSLGLASLTQNLQSIMSQTASSSSRRPEPSMLSYHRAFDHFDPQQQSGKSYHSKAKED